MASAALAQRSIHEREAILARLETNVSETGKWERRTVVLTDQALEVRGTDGMVLRRFPLHELAGAAVQETGGGAWIEALSDQGQTYRLGFCALSGIKAMQAFHERVRERIMVNLSPGAVEKEDTASSPPPLEDTEEAVRLSWSDRFRIVVELAKFAAPFRRQIIGSCIILLVTIALEAVPPYLMKYVIDGAVLSSSASSFAGLIGLLVAVYILLAAFQVWRTSIGIRVGGLLVGRIRNEMFDKLMDLPVRYYERRKTAPFIGRIQHDAEWVQDFVTAGATQLLAQFILSGVIMAMMFILDWRLTLIMLALLPPCLSLVLIALPKLRSLRNRKWNVEYDLQQYISEALQGFRVIKAFHREHAEKQKFGALNSVAIQRTNAQQTWSQWVHASIGLALSCGIALAWFIGGKRVIEGTVSLGSVIAFTTYLSMFLGHMESNGRAIGWMNSALAAADRILDLLRAAPEAASESEPISLPCVRGEMTVDSVRFEYEQGRSVLRDISMHIRAGEKIGIVGRSGAGKTTLIHLLCRFYDPDDGCIRLDGVDLRRIARADLRKHVGIVFQETYLFDGTIAQNIQYGHPGASAEQIVQAAYLANAHSFISRLPYGYDTLVGERGVQLSGGEKQRISIARTLLSNPSLLILDEATSSVDLETEKEIQEALERLSEGRTTIAIAHRLSTLRRVDRIYVIDQGRIVDTGTHEQLSEHEGIYRRLLSTQQSGFLVGEGMK